MTESLTDALRFVVVTLWLINLLATSFTMMFYGVAVGSEWRRNNLRYVLALGMSYMAFSTTAVLESFHRLGDPVTWRLYANLFGALLGAYAIVSLMFHERSRYHAYESDRAQQERAVTKDRDLERERG